MGVLHSHYPGNFRDSLHHVRFREVGVASFSWQRRHGARWQTFGPASRWAARFSVSSGVRLALSEFPCRPADHAGNPLDQLRARQPRHRQNAAMKAPCCACAQISLFVATLGLLRGPLARHQLNYSASP